MKEFQTELTGFSHDKLVPTLVLSSQEYLRDDDQNPTAFSRLDCPHALHVVWIITRVVWTLNITLKLLKYSTAFSICQPKTKDRI